MVKVRRAVRAVIFDQDNNLAVLDVKNGDHYKIPGGGINENETIEEALRREVLEEAGCEIEIIGEVGEFEFLSEKKDRIHHSVCFVAKCIGDKNEPTFDDFEQEREFKLIWVRPERAIELFKGSKPKEYYDVTIVNRDLAFIVKGLSMLKK